MRHKLHSHQVERGVGQPRVQHVAVHVPDALPLPAGVEGCGVEGGGR